MIKVKDITLKEDNTKLSACIEYNNEINEIWYKTDKQNGKYLCFERADSFVVGLLLFAMEKEEDIVVEKTPVSAKLYQNLNITFIPALAKAGNRYKKIKIIADTTSEKIDNAGYNGQGMSCGIDSFMTLADFTSNLSPENLKINCLTLFNMGSSGDMGGEEARALYNSRKERTKKFAKEYGYHFVEIDSNLSEFLQMNFFETHTLRNCSAALAIQKMFKNYYYSSGNSIKDFKIDHYRPATYDIFSLNMISNDNISFYSAGVPYNRIEKTKIVSEFKPSYKYLNVCVREDENCTQCEKCIRTILALEALDKLENYKEVFDLKLIKENKTKMEEFMLRKMDENLSWYKEIYNLMKENGKEISIEKKFRAKQSSYELFKNSKETVYAQETILSLDCNNIEKVNKTIGISVIDLSIREEIKDKQLEYEDFIKRIIIKFAKRNYSVYLFSFNEIEQDNKAIERVLEKVPKKYQKRVKVINYNNNIQEFIKQYSKMEYIVATRYYSLILSALFDQKIYNLIYTKRQADTLEGLNLEKNYIKIQDLTYDTIMNNKEFVQVDREKIPYIKEILHKEWKFFDKPDNIINMKQDYLNEQI